jgi:cytochrome c oxidase cbb3-type subunit 1
VAEASVSIARNGRSTADILFAGSVLAYLCLDAAAFAAAVGARVGLLPSLAWLGWAQIHLLTIGVVLQAALGLVLRAFRGRSGSPAADYLVWLLVNSGLLLLLLGMSSSNGGLASLAAVVVLLALLIVVSRAFLGVAQGAAMPHRRRFYAGGLTFLLVGIALALQMLRGWPSPAGYAGVLEAHIHANVWGFLGLIAGGTCLSALPRLTGAPLAHPVLARRCFWFLTLGSAGLVGGAWLGVLPLIMMGMVLYVVGTLMVLANLLAAARHVRWRSPWLGHVIAAYVWIVVPAVIAPVVVLRTGQLPAGGVETAALGAIISGWVLQLALAAVCAGLAGGDPSAASSSWAEVVVFNLGVLAVWLSALTTELTWAIVAGYVLILAVWIPLLVKAVTMFRPAMRTMIGVPFASR